jgi:H+-translocating NAD(P) transhydrogenase subunit alpha
MKCGFILNPAVCSLLSFTCVAHLYCQFFARLINHLQTYYMEAILTWIADNQQMIYIVILMIFVGIEVIGHVPSVLHTPLMSGANAIHGVVIIGAIIVMGKAEQHNYVALILGFLAVVLGTVNVVGGFVVTDRMLEMFKGKGKNSKSQNPGSK